MTTDELKAAIEALPAECDGPIDDATVSATERGICEDGDPRAFWAEVYAIVTANR